MGKYDIHGNAQVNINEGAATITAPGAKPDVLSRSDLTEHEKTRLRLCIAAMEGDHVRLKAMLSCGLDPDVPDRYGNTPLHIAVFAGSAAAVAELITRGADPDKPCPRSGKSAREMAKMFGNAEVIDTIRNYSPVTRRSFFGGAAWRITKSVGAIRSILLSTKHRPAAGQRETAP